MREIGHFIGGKIGILRLNNANLRFHKITLSSLATRNFPTLVSISITVNNP